MVNNEDRNTCSSCGGKCCKNLPGAFAPEEVSMESLGLMLSQRQLEVTLEHHGVPLNGEFEYRVAWVVRPVRQESGWCVFLGEEGCTLDFHDRPWEWRALVPGIICKGLSQAELVSAWVPYKEKIEAIKEEWDLYGLYLKQKD